MIVKFLSSTPSFSGVEYNTNKMDTGKGELMEAHNFGQLQGISDLRPEDYKNYLKAVSSKSNSIKNPQLHVALSAKGSEFDKYQLTDIAVKWMNEMGYGQQPFLIVFHNDTSNNHVHIVSTRVDQETGKKIAHDFERVRGMEAINRILGIGDKISSDLKSAQEYNFRTEAQFSMLLEKMGYTVKSDGDTLRVIKFGKEQGTIPKAEVKQLAKENKVDDKRLSQLKAIVGKYQKVYDGAVKPVHENLPGGGQGRIIGYQSPLSDYLHKKFGLESVFHFKDDKSPYGYTLIDNANKNVFKGSEILPLKEFISSNVLIDRNWFEHH
ncbi:relaxase/mobilization nuclease domain-containing protein, partial [Pedobacter antarcticus]|uniref:relaxase/mobilization nuclease domain-containing protein n=1 Tax=Pedobacter antarcticus TaxID=34086 RepID=UPI00055D20E1